MGFFEELEAICATQNAHLDELLEGQRAIAANQVKQEEEAKKLQRRNWAVGVLEAGNMPLEKVDRVTAAMMIVVTDNEISCSEVERMLLKHDHYKPVIYQSLVEKFLERGGNPAGEIGTHCIRRALSIEPGTDLFKDGKACESLGMGLLVLGRFNHNKRPEIAGAYQLLRKLFPFTKNGNLQNIPHKLGMRLYPEHYDADWRCAYRFASRLETGESRKVKVKLNHNKPLSSRRDHPEELDKEVIVGMEMAEQGKIPGIRLIRAS